MFTRFDQHCFFSWCGGGLLRPSPRLSHFSGRCRGNFFLCVFFWFCFFSWFPLPSSFLPVPCASATLIIFPSPPPPVRNSPRVHTASQATNRARSTRGKQKKKKTAAARLFARLMISEMCPPLPPSPSPAVSHSLPATSNLTKTLRRDTVQAPLSVRKIWAQCLCLRKKYLNAVQHFFFFYAFVCVNRSKQSF